MHPADMQSSSALLPIKALFLDIGGVLLTNGWDHHMRRHAAGLFGLDYEEIDERHQLTFDTYEEGKLTLDEYLHRVIFYKERPFSMDDFRSFMFAQSQPYPDMIALVKRLKSRYGLKIATISNEGRELTEHRIRAFELGTFVDLFISSCFVHFRKPDQDIFRMALDTAQVPADQAIYVEDRPMFVEVAGSLGIHGIRHVDCASTCQALSTFGLCADT